MTDLVNLTLKIESQLANGSTLEQATTGHITHT